MTRHPKGQCLRRFRITWTPDRAYVTGVPHNSPPPGQASYADFRSLLWHFARHYFLHVSPNLVGIGRNLKRFG
jgi:hypothetical protein